jgi:hypothetical protein
MPYEAVKAVVLEENRSRAAAEKAAEASVRDAIPLSKNSYKCLLSRLS